jgi:hypothetical protein
MSEMQQVQKGRSEAVVDVSRRRQRVDEILGDQSIFPTSFGPWIRRYLEGSGITWPASSIIGLKPKLAAITSLRREHDSLRARVEALEQRVSSLQGDRL